MTNNEEDFDVAPHDEFEEGESPRKPSLKEAWESNPFMKIAALVLGAAVLAGGYIMVFGAGEEQEQKAVIRGDFGQVKQVAGKEDLDPEYQKQLEAENKRRAEAAAQRGGSAIPTPIGTAKETGLALPNMPEQQEDDPLREWRKQAEAKRMTVEKQVLQEEDAAPQPEIVPLVQPVRPQQAAIKMDPKYAEMLSKQMRVIIGGHAPGKTAVAQVTQVDSEYVVMQREREMMQQSQIQMANASYSGAAMPAGEEKEAFAKVIVPGGSIAYAQLLNELNSDVPGPVLAHVLSGPFAGGRAIGKMETKQEFIVITFNHIVKDGVTYQIDALALDEQTTLGAHQTDVDHHYFTRIILPAAAKFVEGYAGAVAQTGTSVTGTAGGGTATETPEPSANEELLKGGEEAAKKVSEILDENANRPVTVKVAKGTTMGLFFTNSVTTESIGK